MAEGKARSRARDAFAELDAEIEKINKSGELSYTKKGPSKPAKRPAAKAPAKSAPAKGKATPGPKGQPGKASIRGAIDEKIKKTQSESDYRKSTLAQAPFKKTHDRKSTLAQAPFGKGGVEEYESSVTKTTKAPATVKGRKGTETTKVTAGTMSGKSDNPQMQRASDDTRVKAKYLTIARNASSREAIRAKLEESGSPDLEAFNRAYPQKKKK